MKIAIVAPSPIPFGPGGAEAVWAGLFHEYLTSSPHDVELIKLPIRETNLVEVMSAYESFAGLDLSHFDLVISGKYPAWMVRHPRHVVYMLHPLRGLYDSYHHFGLPESSSSSEPLVRALLTRAASLHVGALPLFFRQFREAVRRLGQDHPDFQFPGPLARTLVHAMDGVGLAPGAISRYLAISRTVAQRTDYFPPGTDVQVVHPPSDLDGLHEAPGEYFFTASRHDGPKRLDLLIDGMRHYPGDRRLLIAGTGPLTPRLRELARADPRIELVGRVSQEELVEHYARAVGVPFIPVDEDLGLITYEAMRSGKPVLTARDSGGPTEFVRHGVNGVIVKPTAVDIGQGLAALESLAASPRTADASRRAVASISWSRLAAELVREGQQWHASSEPRSGRPRLVVTSTFPIWPPRNGGQLRAYHLYGALASRYDVELVCLAPPARQASTRMIRPGLVEHVVPRTREHEAEEQRVTEAAALPVTDIVAGRLVRHTPAYTELLVRLLDGAAGLLLADPFLQPAVAGLVGDVPVLYDAYNCEYILKSQMLPPTEVRERLLEEVWAVEAAACAQAALILTVSEEDRLSLHELYGASNERFVTTPNGVDIAAVPYTSGAVRQRNKERWLGSLRARGAGEGITDLAVFVGSWHLPNNDAARAMIAMAHRVPEVGFLLLGSHTASLRRTVIPPNVFLLGEVSDAVKLTVLATADVALAPLTTGSGTNLKVVEYLAAGIPVISTLVGMRGLKVPTEAVRVAELDDFPEAIRLQLAAASVSGTHTVKARLAVERSYDWRAIGERVLPRLDDVLLGVPRRTGARG